ncbi:MAG: beta-ketoacyl synthase [Gammaproteobacteria bacterium]
MSRLPVITAFGGISPAGRSSAHHGFRRLVIDALPAALADATWQSLAQLMGEPDGESEAARARIRAHTLVRRIEPSHFDSERIPWNRRLHIAPAGEEAVRLRLRGLPAGEALPEGWQALGREGRSLEVALAADAEILVPSERRSDVHAAGQLPGGFEPGALYPSRNHPRGLQMTVFGASDALGELGIPWETVLGTVSPERISVYAGSGMSQLDANGNGGMVASRFMGRRVSSKQCPFGFAEMPADFINAYVLGSLGNTGTSMGACASFLYNLRLAVSDIQSGRASVALVGNAEAPITPEVIEGYAAMGALATDAGLRALDGLADTDTPDHRRACRPFAENCGFTIAESAQFVVLMDAELALALGASVHAAVADVFVNADGYKKSISAPGAGNYLTVARAAALARAIVGEEGLRRRSFVHAHGTGTPQNRVTESHILDETARVFGIRDWPVCAVKSYLGHSIGAAAADQLVMALGSWAHGLLPGILTASRNAADVHAGHLDILRAHRACAPEDFDVALLNAKGFGGNNATATLLAPHVARGMMERRFGREAMRAWSARNAAVRAAAEDHDRRASRGEAPPVYRFDHGVLAAEDLQWDASAMRVPGYPVALALDMPSPYADWQ